MKPRAEDRAFDRLLQILCPTGRELLAVMEAYFDESGTHTGAPVMCVSGCLFNPRNARNLVKEWRGELRRVQRLYPKVEFFHMKELAPGAKQFKDVPDDERGNIERKLVSIIARYRTYGFTVAVREAEFFEVAPADWISAWGQPYTVCVRTCLHYIGHWADQHRYFGPIAYLFESGHRHQAEANDLLNRFATNPEARKAVRYGSHTFASKRDVLPLQAADVMAWQWTRMETESAIHRRRPIRRSMHDLAIGRGTRSANQMDYLTGDRLLKLLAENPVQ